MFNFFLNNLRKHALCIFFFSSYKYSIIFTQLFLLKMSHWQKFKPSIFHCKMSFYRNISFYLKSLSTACCAEYWRKICFGRYLGARVREDPTPESRLSRPSMFSAESSCDSSPVVMSWSLVSGEELVRLVTSGSSLPFKLSSVSKALKFFRERWLSSSDLFTVELWEEVGGSNISATKWKLCETLWFPLLKIIFPSLIRNH